MPEQRLFVFTAGNQAARQHLHDSIISPIDWSENSQFWQGEATQALSKIDQGEGLYAWGAVPGQRNIPTWEQMTVGDWVLCVYDNTYQYAAKILAKYQNPEAAQAIWGADPSGQTWEYMYFLSRPTKIEIPLEQAAPHLYQRYQGFTQFTDDRLDEIENRYGSIDAFIDAVFLAPSMGWEPFADTMLRYQEGGVVYQSVSQGHQYYVSRVEASRCQVERVTASEPAQVTFSAYETAVNRLRDAGGTATFADLHSTVAMRTSFLQGGDLWLSPDRRDTILLKDLQDAEEALVSAIETLRVDRSGKQPKKYKPALIEAIILGVDRKLFGENRFSFDELCPLVLEVFEQRSIQGGEQQVALAYFHLASDLLWTHAYEEPNNPILRDPSPGLIRARISFATLKNSFWEVLQDSSARQRVQTALERSWFTPETSDMKYFLVRSNHDSDYGDILGEQYAYHNRVPNSYRLFEGGRIVVDRKIFGEVKLLGYGDVEPGYEQGKDEKGNKKFYSKYSHWKAAESEKSLTEALKQKIQSSENYNVQHAIRPIDKDTFDALARHIDPNYGGDELPQVPDSGMTAQPLNQVLYGPPGTGKTYITRERAVEIADPNWYSGTQTSVTGTALKKALVARYQELESEGRIVFTTFHQSFGYEDFVEGIRANTDDESGAIRYDLEPGIFKNIVERSKQSVSTGGVEGLSSSPSVWKISIGRKAEAAILNHCLENGEARVGWNGLGDLNVPYEERSDSEREKWDTMPAINRKPIEEFADEVDEGDVFLLFKTKETIQAVGIVESEYRYDNSLEGHVTPNYPQVRKVNWIAKDLNLNILGVNKNKALPRKTFCRLKRISWGSIAGLLAKQGIQTPRTESAPINHVLIIDEINRGNISRIFGELITLLEPSKRVGGNDEREVVLPYSKDHFSIPSNLYVIGTMNTADKSLTQMDIALRRRFTFVEMPPQAQLLAGTAVYGVDLGSLLNVINQRIEILLDRDHLIGHSYFLEIKNLAGDAERGEALAFTFRHAIIPLLQEYFFEDWERIAWVLNDDQKGDDQDRFIHFGGATSLAELFPESAQEHLIDRRYSINEEAFRRSGAYTGILSPS